MQGLSLIRLIGLRTLDNLKIVCKYSLQTIQVSVKLKGGEFSSFSASLCFVLGGEAMKTGSVASLLSEGCLM